MMFIMVYLKICCKRCRVKLLLFAAYQVKFVHASVLFIHLNVLIALKLLFEMYETFWFVM